MNERGSTVKEQGAAERGIHTIYGVNDLQIITVYCGITFPAAPLFCYVQKPEGGDVVCIY